MKRRRSPAASLLALLAAGWFGPVVCQAAADEAEAGRRVVMADFTSDDGLIASAEGAAQWSLLTQATLAAREPDVQWIERAQLHLAAEELHLSAGGFTSAAGTLRAGRWLKADVAVLGRFTRNEHDGDGHTLRLEIVDLDHADTLAVRTVPVPGDRRETIELDGGLVQTTVSALHDALAEARGKRRRDAGRLVIAPLFVRNADPSPRLDGFGPAVVDALTRGADGSADLRVLRFPQADRTRGEAELVVGGFTDAGGPRRVADFYVWGSYREVPVAGTDFAHTPVEIDLTLWDGARPPQHLTERAAVADLPALAGRLADRCLEASRHAPADHAPLPSGERTPSPSVAGLLRQQGEEMAAVLDGYGAGRDAFLNTPAGKRVSEQAHLLLETACFFAPDDRAAQAARLRLQWGGFPVPKWGWPLLDAWRCANEVVTVAECCEAAGDATGDFRRARLDLDVYLLEQLGRGEANLHEPHSEPNLPVDVPDATLAAWHAALDERFAHDAEEFAKTASSPSAGAARIADYGGWLRPLFRRVRDPARGMRVLEALWPSFGPLYQQDPKTAENYCHGDESLTAEVRKFALRQHQSERGETLLAALSARDDRAPAASAPPAATPAALAVLTPVMRVPRYAPPVPDMPVPTPASKMIVFALRDPSGASLPDITTVPRYTVRSLAADGEGAVWMSVLREKGIDQKLAPTEQSQDLARFEPGSGTFQFLLVPGLAAHPPVATVLPADGGVWLAQDFTGLIRYDPAAAAVTRRYTVADGLATTNVDGALTDGAGRTILVGRERGLALLQEYDPARQAWLRVGPSAENIPAAPAADSMDAYLPPTAQLAACGHWLLTGLGGRWTLLDHANGQTRDLRPLLDRLLPTDAPRGRSGSPFQAGRWLARAPRLCSADAGGFWLVDDGRIVRFDPARPEAMRAWPLPAELRLGMTALASDGEDLWIVGPSGKTHPPTERPAPLAMQLPPMPGVPLFGLANDGRGFVAILRVADGQWRGGFEVTERVSCLAVSQKALYLGLTTAAQPLIEIDKASVLSGGGGH